jgi:N-acetylglucosamine-6-phosphate deacetylase
MRPVQPLPSAQSPVDSAGLRVLSNVRIPGLAGLHQVTIARGAIAAIQPHPATVEPNPSQAHQDWQGDWLSLGGIDVQINGALGLAFPDLTTDNAHQLSAIGNYLWQQGVDGYLPTLVTSSVEAIHTALESLAPQIGTATTAIGLRQTAQPVGVHLEGPFLNPAKRGAHPQEHLQPLTLDWVKRVLGDYASVVRVMTLAPELDQTGQVIPYLRSLGITVSLGHSLATAEQATRAFEQGARMVTHAFNAMPPLHHREPGLLAAAIAHPQVQCGLIADGQHVSPLMMDILLKASAYDQGIFLVSDALAPLGLPDGRYPWDSRQIEVNQGTARLLDGTLSGTTLPLLVGTQNLVKWCVCSVEQAIALATTAPRRAIGLCSDYLGQPATLLRWHQDSTGGLQWQRVSDGV